MYFSPIAKKSLKITTLYDLCQRLPSGLVSLFLFLFLPYFSQSFEASLSTQNAWRFFTFSILFNYLLEVLSDCYLFHIRGEREKEKKKKKKKKRVFENKKQ
eukprot:TRINITY_DN633_c0_g3_i1.p1 TRINITY_DN633_c0_g3~~TRINITY_DN633_c0_g3_i1.p1  ORF type:complete len:101 (-),score=1.27 TRINITY_DN633_c0_g3_i1:103-405(-)